MLTQILQQIADDVIAMNKAEGYDLLKYPWGVVSIQEVKNYRELLKLVDPQRILVLKNDKIRVMVIDFIGMEVTDEIATELETLIAHLPRQTLEVYGILEPGKIDEVLTISGIIYLYPKDAAKYLARGVYAIRKATGWGQRVGKKAGGDFERAINDVLRKYFKENEEYLYTPGGDLDFKFFKIRPSDPFGKAKERNNNFKAGIETKWVDGHETEKLGQIRDKYFNKGYVLIAILAPNVSTWRNAIANPKWGNFANYYLFINRDEESELDEIIVTRKLARAYGDRDLEETEDTVISLLHKIKVTG